MWNLSASINLCTVHCRVLLTQLGSDCNRVYIVLDNTHDVMLLYKLQDGAEYKGPNQYQ